MAISYGFYSALYKNNAYDRIYQSSEMSKLFDGVILDGVYLSSRKDDPANQQFMVSANTDNMNIKVAPGRAWFIGTYTISDSPLTFTIDTANSTHDRIDAVVIEVNNQITTYNPADPGPLTERFNTIRIVKGTPAAEPSKPTMTHSDGIDQYPIAYITVAASTTSIRPYDIEYVVGIETPYFAWVIEKLSIAQLYSKWKPILDLQTIPFIKWFESMQRMLGRGNEDYENIVDEVETIKEDDYVAGIYPKIDEQEAKFSGDGSTKVFTITVSAGAVIKSIADILVNGEMVYDYTFNPETNKITFESAPPSGTNNVIVYYVVDAETYTIYFEEV